MKVKKRTKEMKITSHKNPCALGTRRALLSEHCWVTVKRSVDKLMFEEDNAGQWFFKFNCILSGSAGCWRLSLSRSLPAVAGVAQWSASSILSV